MIPDFPLVPLQRNGTILEALTSPAGDEEEAAAAYYDALEAAASPTEVGCYDQLTPLHEASFIKARRRETWLSFTAAPKKGKSD